VDILEYLLSRCVQNFSSIEVCLVQFRIRKLNFELLKSALVSDMVLADSDFSLSDLQYVCFVGLV
jgi:hypothetical protein